MFSLNNQIAVVTGAATGIGKGIASALCEAGATVVIAGCALALRRRDQA